MRRLEGNGIFHPWKVSTWPCGGPRTHSALFLPTSAMSSDPRYVLKVFLYEIEPQIWRRFSISGEATMAQLHTALQEAMGWCIENYTSHRKKLKEMEGKTEMKQKLIEFFDTIKQFFSECCKSSDRNSHDFRQALNYPPIESTIYRLWLDRVYLGYSIIILHLNK